jgi:hypothetical protein
MPISNIRRGTMIAGQLLEKLLALTAAGAPVGKSAQSGA